jgi:ferredoxin
MLMVVIKHNFYHDQDYCTLLALCISHKCPYGVITMANETFMAERMMNMINEIHVECGETNYDD